MPESDLVNDAFDTDFSGRLILFHAMHDAALTKKTFEYLFCGACRAAGRIASQTLNEVHAGEDVIIDDEKFSLKTEGSKSIKANSIHISKLMEARWIRECISGHDFATKACTRIGAHLTHYGRIISLRSFAIPHGFRYELVEIPKSVLLRLSTLSAVDSLCCRLLPLAPRAARVAPMYEPPTAPCSSCSRLMAPLKRLPSDACRSRRASFTRRGRPNLMNLKPLPIRRLQTVEVALDSKPP